MRKGYAEEYLAKKELIRRFGSLGVIKVAISQFGADFICFRNGSVILAVEVKACHDNKYYPSKKDKLQFKRIKEFCEFNRCMGEVWVKYPYEKFEERKIWDMI
jgi:Holliday junction resolvase